MSKPRIIDGKKYSPLPSSVGMTKGLAKKLAKEYRAKGKNARVIQDRWGWSVWVAY